MRKVKGTTMIELVMVVIGIAILMGLSGLGLSAASTANSKKLTSVAVSDISKEVVKEMTNTTKVNNRKAFPDKDKNEAKTRQNALNEVKKMLLKMDSDFSLVDFEGDLKEFKLYPSRKEDAWGTPICYAVSYYDNPCTGTLIKIDPPPAEGPIAVAKGDKDAISFVPDAKAKDKELRIWIVSAGVDGTMPESIGPLEMGLIEEKQNEIWALAQSVNGKCESAGQDSAVLNVFEKHTGAGTGAEHAKKCRCMAYAYVGLKV